MKIVINNKFQIAVVVKESNKTYRVMSFSDASPILHYYSRFMKKDSVIYYGKLTKNLGILLDEFIALNTAHLETIKVLRKIYYKEVAKLSEKLKKLG